MIRFLALMTVLTTQVIAQALANFPAFTKHYSQITLRNYQKTPAAAIIDSVIHNRGLSFVVMFPRQSGKNELQAQIETFLLALYFGQYAEMVKVSPTWKPQSLNAMRRLQRNLESNLITQALKWKKESGYIYRVGKARITFFSGQPEANIVGATASTLLEVDEAQDVTPAKFDKDIAPMAASTNATRVFWGTAWTSQTLLARELRSARQQEQQDGIRRTFVLSADDVSKELPPYQFFVQQQIASLGRNHPLIKSQYFSEEIDSEGGLFPTSRIALMQGRHTQQTSPTPGETYVFALDIAGADESSPSSPSPFQGEGRGEGKRDSTALTIARINRTTITDPLIHAPTYEVIARHLWTNAPQTALYAALKALADLWNPRFIVTDATGIGAGLTNFLQAAFPAAVIPFTFTQSSKSKLGWDFLAVVDSGRFKDYASEDALQQAFRQQLTACQYEIKPGQAKTLVWSVPDGSRNPEGDYLHDDLIISAALLSTLDAQDWAVTGAPLIIPGIDPLQDMDKGF